MYCLATYFTVSQCFLTYFFNILTSSRSNPILNHQFPQLLKKINFRCVWEKLLLLISNNRIWCFYCSRECGKKKTLPIYLQYSHMSSLHCCNGTLFPITRFKNSWLVLVLLFILALITHNHLATVALDHQSLEQVF